MLKQTNKIHINKNGFYLLLKNSVIHKWSVTASSDGYDGYRMNNVLTNDGYGPGGFSNPGAWYVIGNTINSQLYEFCVQTDGYYGYRIKYSKLGFTNGNIGLVEVPSATDEQILMGGGSDSNPTYQKIVSVRWNVNNNSLMLNINTQNKIFNFSLKPKLPTLPTVNKILT